METALRVRQQVCRVVVKTADAGVEHTYSTSRACPNHPDQSLPEMEPRFFSFNAPQGACATCSGLGTLDRAVPRKEQVEEPRGP